MQKTSFLIVSLLVGTALVAGCVDGDKPTNYRATGTNGYGVVGFARDGQGITPFDGTITIQADDRANTGQFVAEGTWKGEAWKIVFDSFSGSGFRDGGIATNLWEHGDTGVADTSIPKVWVELAAWGTAEVTKGAAALTDPITGDERLVAHLMVIRTGVRDDSTLAMYAGKDKVKYYNPDNASQGYSDANDTEIHLVLKSKETPPANATEFSVPSQSVNTVPVAPGAPQPNMYTETHDLFTNEYIGSVATFTFDMSGNPTLYDTNLELTVRSPSGEVIDQTLAGESTNQQQSVPFTFLAQEAGVYQLEVRGDGRNAEYSIQGTLAPPEAIVWNFWWEDVVLGDAPMMESSSEGHGDTHTA